MESIERQARTNRSIPSLPLKVLFSDGCIRDLRFNLHLHQKLIGVLVWWQRAIIRSGCHRLKFSIKKEKGRNSWFSKKEKKKRRKKRRRRKALTCLHLSLNAGEDCACGAAALVLWFKHKNQLYLEWNVHSSPNINTTWFGLLVKLASII